MRIALAQIDTTVGDFAGNRRTIAKAAHEARRQGADLVVTPELALCGYPPEDLLLRPGFLAAHERALQELTGDLPPDLPVLVGCLAANERRKIGGRPLCNAVALVEDGLARVVARKCLLPTYDIFDESRYFEPWTRPQENLLTVAGRKVGLAVCEDGWNDAHFFRQRLYPVDPVERLVQAGAELVVNLSASPWNHGKERLRADMLRAAARRHRVPFLYCNLVGGNVGLLFDGGSMAVKPEGFAFTPVLFEEGLFVVDTGAPWQLEPVFPERVEMSWRALVRGLRDYFAKFGFARAVLGVSGGIDSAVTAALAVDALGPGNVVGLALPSSFSTPHSLADAEALCRNLGIRLEQLPIQDAYEAVTGTLQPLFGDRPFDVTEENVQARIRGVLLMAYSNKFGHLLLATGNKSEAAMGFCTLYGDMCGALAVLGDLWKTEVYELARWLNREGERIPAHILAKPPSPELRPGQLTTDSLPPYDVLDPVLRLLVEEDVPVSEVARRTGMAPGEVAGIFARMQKNEFKRYQYAPTLRVTERCWDGRRVPVAHSFLVEG